MGADSIPDNVEENETPDDEQARMENEFNRKLNSGIRGHLSRHQKAMDEQLKTMTASLREEILNEIRAGKPESEEGAKKEEDSEVSRLKARLANMEKKANDSEAQRIKEKQESLKVRERAALSSALREVGVEGPKLKAAIALLYTEEGRVGTDQDGNVIFKFQRDGYIEEMSLADGMEEWVATSDGKHFVPAKNVGGAGSTGGLPPSKSKKAWSKAEARKELARGIMREF